jgi:hypothetical protein
MDPENPSQSSSQSTQQDKKLVRELDSISFDSFKKWYMVAIGRKQTKLGLLTLFLSALSLCQFFIIDYSLLINFGIDQNSPDFLSSALPILFISGLITAALPITTFIDEFELLSPPLELTINQTKLSPILWIILPADFLLTFQAICTIGWENTERGWLVILLGFFAAAIFATSSLYVSRGIATSFNQLKEAQKHLQILEAYRINPIDLYEDIERLRLHENLKKADEKSKKIETDFSTKINDLNQKNSEALKEKEKLRKEITLFEESINSINDLRKSFNKIRDPIVELIGQGRGIFGKFSELNESVQNFRFPPVKVPTGASKNRQSSVQPIYFMKWQNSNYSWEDLKLPSEISAVGRRLLGLIVQQGNLPQPKIQEFKPRNNASSCMTLQFEEYDVIVYCRDEDYKQGEAWTFEDQAIFEEQVVKAQHLGLRVLRFSPQEMMSNPEKIIDKISDALISGHELEDEA